MEFEVVPRTDGISHVSLRGSLDAAGLREVDVQFRAATAGREQPAIVDVSGLDYINSLGIGMLFGCATSLSRKGHRMVVLNATGLVADVMRTVGVPRVVPFATSLAEAERLAKG
ncbi:MAG TPA: STAS domain-containing protein [Candidatus Krumholzibacteria bacterium]|nr:STAS domain-containing protein [Candidatus Krumholzibacteria bacterium]